MANRLYNEDSIRDIASAIREKNGTANTYNVAEMGQAIRGIQTESGGITPTGTIQINTNGTHDVTQYASASVNVPTGITPSGEITISENGSFDVTQFATAIVNVATGGGGGSIPLFSKMDAGVFVPSEDIGLAPLPNTKPGTSVEIPHSLGVVPDIAILVNITPSSDIVGPELILSGKTATADFAMCYRNAELATTNSVGNEGKFCAVDADKATFAGNGTSTYGMRGNHSYLWVVGKL